MAPSSGLAASFILTGVILLVFSVTHGLDTACEYPSFATDVPYWESQVADERNVIGSFLIFRGDRLNIRTSYPFAQSSYKCIQEVLPGKYIVAELTPSGESIENYRCFQFLSRSLHVMQMLESETSDDIDTTMCDDQNLVMNDWPLVWPVVRKVYEPCPSIGGFDFDTYDAEIDRVLCRDLIRRPRVESECTTGEGLLFSFTYRDCMGSLNMATTQKTWCLGTWEQDQYIYTVITDNGYFISKLWLVRLPIELSDTMEMYISKDVMIDKTPVMTKLTDHIVLNMTRKVYSSLCEDEASDCTGSCLTFSNTCQKTCDVCTYLDSVKACHFNNDTLGEYMDITRYGETDISVSRTVLQADGMPPMTCLGLSEGLPTEHFAEKVVSTVFQNGCKPRYHCVDMEQSRISEAILDYRLSRTMVWPHTTPLVAGDMCTHSNFKDDEEPLYSQYRSSRTKRLIRKVSSDYQRELTWCNFESNYAVNTTLSDGSTCHGTLVTCTALSSVQLKWESRCADYPMVTQYNCFASFGGSETQIILAEDKADPQKVYCFGYKRNRFGVLSDMKIFLMAPSDCTETLILDNLYQKADDYILMMPYNASGPPSPQRCETLPVPPSPSDVTTSANTPNHNVPTTTPSKTTSSQPDYEATTSGPEGDGITSLVDMEDDAFSTTLSDELVTSLSGLEDATGSTWIEDDVTEMSPGSASTKSLLLSTILEGFNDTLVEETTVETTIVDHISSTEYTDTTESLDIITAQSASTADKLPTSTITTQVSNYYETTVGEIENQTTGLGDIYTTETATTPASSATSLDDVDSTGENSVATTEMTRKSTERTSETTASRTTTNSTMSPPTREPIDSSTERSRGNTTNRLDGSRMANSTSDSSTLTSVRPNVIFISFMFIMAIGHLLASIVW